MGLQQFEQRLERLVEGAFAKALRGELQPVELGRRLTREMDLHRAVSVRGLIAPNAFEVNLSEQDFSRFGGFVDVLARELVDAAREHARSERYSFLGPVEVSIGVDPHLGKTVFDVSVSVVESEDVVSGYIVLPDGHRIGVSAEPVTVGRLDECLIQINDPNVSRRHAEFRQEGPDVFVVDLQSTNGTKVNGSPIRRQRLVDGDVITVGITPMRFEAN